MLRSICAELGHYEISSRELSILRSISIVVDLVLLDMKMQVFYVPYSYAVIWKSDTN